MKKQLAAILAGILVIGTAACGGSGAGQSGVSAAAGEEKAGGGTLSIATSPDFPPFESLDGEKIVGIEAELMELICEKIGVTPEFVQMDFDSVLAGVQAGKYDVGMSGISITEEREKNVLFTDAYCMAAQSIVVTESSEISSKADLDGKKISVQSGTTAEAYCLANGYDVSSFQANSDAEQAMASGKTDAWVIDDLTAAQMVKVYNEAAEEKLVVLEETMTSEPYAFVMKKGREEMIERINSALKELIADGTVKALFEKYEAPFTAPEAQ